ncbi:MAG: enoyl-CoA hydratase/isomerase family protein [Planctomycetes bacterium]|nr:enoyl-CoA hydratase/isomerase family protein [Planctomycetota bacterium]MCW8135991.1 enoyl-CoA hydratase/isomerase family protein [Planctomycetota bacterium]
MSTVRETLEHENVLLRLTVSAGKGNVFSGAVMRELDTRIAAATQSRTLRLIVLEADGPHFSFGASVDEHTRDRVAEMLPVLRGLVLRIAGSPVPVAARVQGMCLGGAFEVVLACHFTFAARDARFAVPEIRLGVFPPVAAALLPRRAHALTERMILTGEEFSADDLRAAGLLHGICAAPELTGHIDAWFRATLLNFSAESLRHATRAARAALMHGLEAELIAREREYIDTLMPSHDANEGIAAFLERRKPTWRHA